MIHSKSAISEAAGTDQEMHRLSRRSVTVGAVAMAAMPFGAQTQTSLGKSLPEKEAGAARSGGTLAFSVTVGEPSNYDGHASTSISVLHRLAPHYSTLVKISQSRYPEIVGDAAESWQVSDDGLSYRFEIGRAHV